MAADPDLVDLVRAAWARNHPGKPLLAFFEYGGQLSVMISVRVIIADRDMAQNLVAWVADLLKRSHPTAKKRRLPSVSLECSESADEPTQILRNRPRALADSLRRSRSRRSCCTARRRIAYQAWAAGDQGRDHLCRARGARGSDRRWRFSCWSSRRHSAIGQAAHAADTHRGRRRTAATHAFRGANVASAASSHHGQHIATTRQRRQPCFDASAWTARPQHPQGDRPARACVSRTRRQTCPTRCLISSAPLCIAR